MTKVCSICGKTLPLEEFSTDRRAKSGKCSQCKTCQKEYRKDNKDILSERSKTYRENNKEAISLQRHIFYEENKETILEDRSKYRASHKDILRDRAKKHRENNKDAIREDKRLYYEENKESILLGRQIYYEENRTEILQRVKDFASSNQERVLFSAAKTRSKRFDVPFNIQEFNIVIPELCPILGIPLKREEGKRTDASPSLDRIIPERGYVVGNIAVISDRANRLKNNGTSEEHRKIFEWYKDSPEFPISELGRESTNHEKELLQHAKNRAKKKGIFLDISTSDIVIPESCPILNIPLSRGPGRIHDGSPSLDRIDPAKGYSKGNVIVVSYRANRIRNDGTAEEHLKIADWMDAMSEQRIAA